jgi:SpoVK/Ycf46/Vps4 family AAA+-type ATPase
MFGTILTWLQERKKPVFIVATSNNAESLPAELMRKGRFDEVFFIDLPTTSERKAIAEIHIARRKRNPKLFDLNEIAKATEGFSGSEIEEAICSGLELAFSKDREVVLADIIEAADKTNPLSKTQGAKVQSLREWAKARGVVQAGEGGQVKVTAEPASNPDGSLKRSTISFNANFNKKEGK